MKNILIIEDDISIGNVLEETLTREGYGVLRAYSGTEALCERNITPKIQMTEQKIIWNLDPSALSRIFSNLLNNAIKYSDGDLEITLTEAGELRFANTDSGLNEIQVGKLFDRFYTVESARKSTGLGLAIARNLVEQMGGTITAEYEENMLCICISFS